MRFLANENVPGPVIRSLRRLGHDVVWHRRAHFTHRSRWPSGHVIPYDEPGVVADAVRRVLTACRTGKREMAADCNPLR